MSQCNEHECKIATLSDKATICSLFGMDTPNPEPFETASSNEGIPLCIYHYGVLYRHLNPSHLECVTCSKQIADITVPEPSVIGNSSHRTMTVARTSQQMAEYALHAINLISF